MKRLVFVVCLIVCCFFCLTSVYKIEFFQEENIAPNNDLNSIQVISSEEKDDISINDNQDVLNETAADEVKSSDQSSLNEDNSISDSVDVFKSVVIKTPVNLSSQSTQQTISQPDPQLNNHIILKSKIEGYTFTREHSICAIKKFRNNENYFDRLDCNDFALGLNECWFWYFGFEENYTKIYLPTEQSDDAYRFYKLSDDDFAKGVAKLNEIETSIENYKNFVCSALSSLKLNTSDRDLVDQINRYIVNHFSYQITNNPYVFSFTESKQGQCYHYANLFKDMCNAVGIHSEYIDCQKTSAHAINSVTIDGSVYYFDVTANDTCGNSIAYSWMDEAKARSIYSW